MMVTVNVEMYRQRKLQIQDRVVRTWRNFYLLSTVHREESYHKWWFSICSTTVSFMNIQFNLAKMVQRPRLLLFWGCIFFPGQQNCYYLDSRLYNFYTYLFFKILYNVYKYIFLKMSYTYMYVCVSIYFFNKCTKLTLLESSHLEKQSILNVYHYEKHFIISQKITEQ